MTTHLDPSPSPTLDAPQEDMAQVTREVLDAIEEVFAQYVVFPSQEAADAVTLWVAHTHVFHAFESTPRLAVNSTQPGSGKSRVLEIIEHLVPSPLNAVYMTPGVMWRSIEHSAPTILLDEVDTIFGKNGSGSAHRYLRGIINAGHRKGATVPRTVGSEDVKHFRVFSPVAMAGLGQLPETIATRSVQIEMKKRRPDQEVRPFRLKFAQDALNRVKDMLENWSEDASVELEFACPEAPVQDRQADVWEPLLAIAELASTTDNTEWFDRAWKACEELTNTGSTSTVSPGVRLLTAIKDIFGDAPSMFTADLLTQLQAMPDSPYRNLTPRALSNVLREYNIRPTTVRQGDDIAKGYLQETFEEAWSRYTPTTPNTA